MTQTERVRNPKSVHTKQETINVVSMIPALI